MLQAASSGCTKGGGGVVRGFPCIPRGPATRDIHGADAEAGLRGWGEAYRACVSASPRRCRHSSCAPRPAPPFGSVRREDPGFTEMNLELYLAASGRGKRIQHLRPE